MKTLGRYFFGALIGASLVAKSIAAPVMAVGDNAELFVTATAAVTHDDNIYLRSSTAASDTIWSFQPGVQFLFGQKSATTGQLYFQENFLKYSSNSKQDTNLANIGFKSDYSDGKSKLNLGASWQQFAQNDTSVPGAIVDFEKTNVGATGEVAVSDKTSVGLGALYDKTEYKLGSYSSWANTSIPLDAYFEVSPKLAASVGYRFRDTSVTHVGVSSKDNFFNIGARGEFSPLLTGQIRVGYDTRSFDKGSSQNVFGAQASLAYTVSDKTSLNIGFDNGFGNAASGQNTKTRNISVGAVSQIDSQWSWNASLTSMSTEYTSTRTDNYLEGTAGVAYVYNKQLNFKASYTYRDNGSDLSFAKFTNNVFNVGASIRY